MAKKGFAYICCLLIGFLTLMGVEVSRAFIPWDLIIALKKSAYLESIILFFDVLRISIVLALLSFGAREIYKRLSNWVNPNSAAVCMAFLPCLVGVMWGSPSVVAIFKGSFEDLNVSNVVLNSLFVLWMPFLIYLFRREAERTNSKS